MDKNKEYINYSFYGITFKSDTLKLSNQWRETIPPSTIKAFYIKDAKGLVSPTYYIKGKRSNTFYIYFETARVFENEIWIIKGDDRIIPKGLDGTDQKYILSKK